MINYKKTLALTLAAIIVLAMIPTASPAAGASLASNRYPDLTSVAGAHPTQPTPCALPMPQAQPTPPTSFTSPTPFTPPAPPTPPMPPALRAKASSSPVTPLPAYAKEVKLDLTGRTAAQLKVTAVSEMLAIMGVTVKSSEKIAWGYWVEEYEYYPGYTSMQRMTDTYRVVKDKDKIDMRPELGGSGEYQFDFLVGKGKQLDFGATQYRVTVTVTPVPTQYSMTAALYTDAKPSVKVYPLYDDTFDVYLNGGVWTFMMYIPSNYSLSEQYNLSLNWRDYYSNRYSMLSVETYQGHHTLTTIDSATRVTDIFTGDTSSSGGHKAAYGNEPQEFTLLFKYGGTKIAAQPIRFAAYAMTSRLEYLYESDGSGDSWGTVYGTAFQIGSYVMGQTNDIFKLRYVNGETGKVDNTKITSVIIGEADIKSQAIGDGYAIDTSNSTTAIVVADSVKYDIVIPKASTQPDVRYQPIDEPDVYFQVEGAFGLWENNCYIVPHEHDTTYYNGYQTVLVKNAAGKDFTTIAATFWNEPDIYAGGQKQTNGMSMQDFSGSAISKAGRVEYTAKATNNKDLKNYFVAFVAKSDTNAYLFVNGPLKNGEGYANERLVRFDSYYGDKHDIFIANMGGGKLTNLKATLTGAKNVKLDGWYTVGGKDNDTLGEFVSTESARYTSTGIESAAKIRLVPTRDGEVSGKLTITANGVEPVVINLTGKAGNPKISTKQTQIDAYRAVKWVPYSFLVTTDCEYDWATPRFTCTEGSLPPGLTLRQNGEIYGIPTSPGKYKFTVTAQFDDYLVFPAVSKEYTINVRENTDANVDGTVDDGYSILVRVPAIVDASTDREFVVEGSIDEFVGFYLDGHKLVKNLDYFAESGSTKITIRAQTVTDSGEGTHTIAAEFRVHSDESNTMKRTAQNTLVRRNAGVSGGGSGGSGNSGAGSGSGSGSGSSGSGTGSGSGASGTGTGSGGSSGGTTTPPSGGGAGTNPHKPVTEIFTDVPRNAWYVEDVQWAYDYGYMLGKSNSRFEPNSMQTQAAVFSVLGRVANVNLYNYSDSLSPEIKTGMWYTNAAQWAKAAGLMVTQFDPDAYVQRGDMAVIITRYFTWLLVDTSTNNEPITITDASSMTTEQLYAFTILYKLKIFFGTSATEITMTPSADTTRAQLSALIERLNAYMATHKKA